MKLGQPDIVPLIDLIEFINWKQCKQVLNENNRLLDIVLPNMNYTVVKSHDPLVNEEGYHSLLFISAFLLLPLKTFFHRTSVQILILLVNLFMTS